MGSAAVVVLLRVDVSSSYSTDQDLVPPVQHYSHWAIGASGQLIGAPNTSRRFGLYLPISWQEGYSPSGLALSLARQSEPLTRQSEPEYESEVWFIPSY